MKDKTDPVFRAIVPHCAALCLMRAPDPCIASGEDLGAFLRGAGGSRLFV